MTNAQCSTTRSKYSESQERNLFLPLITFFFFNLLTQPNFFYSESSSFWPPRDSIDRCQSMLTEALTMNVGVLVNRLFYWLIRLKWADTWTRLVHNTLSVQSIKIKSNSHFMTSSEETTFPPSVEMKLTKVLTAALSDLDSGAAPVETWMIFTVQPRTVPKDLRGRELEQQTPEIRVSVTSGTRLTSPARGLSSPPCWQAGWGRWPPHRCCSNPPAPPPGGRTVHWIINMPWRSERRRLLFISASMRNSEGGVICKQGAPFS